MTRASHTSSELNLRGLSSQYVHATKKATFSAPNDRNVTIASSSPSRKAAILGAKAMASAYGMPRRRGGGCRGCQPFTAAHLRTGHGVMRGSGLRALWPRRARSSTGQLADRRIPAKRSAPWGVRRGSRSCRSRPQANRKRRPKSSRIRRTGMSAICTRSCRRYSVGTAPGRSLRRRRCHWDTQHENKQIRLHSSSICGCRSGTPVQLRRRR